MKKVLSISVILFTIFAKLNAQVEPGAGKWKTWFISSGKEYRLAAPGPYKEEIDEVIRTQKNIDPVMKQQIDYWNAGAALYRWQEMLAKLWMFDTTYNGMLSNLLMGVASYDATIVAWDTKYAHQRPRPFMADSRIKLYTIKPESPSYPCDRSVVAGAAVTIIAHFYPSMADSARRMAAQLMAAQVAAGLAFPSDTRDGFALGKQIAEKEIELTKKFPPGPWDGKRLDKAGSWRGTPMFPGAGQSKTVVLDSASQFRPGPPPDFAKDMDELKSYKSNFRSIANAFLFASQPVWEDILAKKIFEYNIQFNPPRAARIYAITAIGMYDGFISCWDTKYTYWGTRPDQYDTTFHPTLIHTPPFPGYPSGHAMIGSIMAELYSYFFPADKTYFQKKAKDGAESRFQGGIHFRTDNEVGLEMGKKVAAAIIKKVSADGAELPPGL